MNENTDTKTKEQILTDLVRRLFAMDGKVESLKFEIMHNGGKIVATCDLTPSQIETLEIISEGSGIPMGELIKSEIFGHTEDCIAELAKPCSGQIEDMTDCHEFPSDKSKARAQVFAACVEAEYERRALRR